MFLLTAYIILRLLSCLNKDLNVSGNCEEICVCSENNLYILVEKNKIRGNKSDATVVGKDNNELKRLFELHFYHT